jgi:2-keto-3-deoxy-6-phosphogluconate aldolase
VALVSGDDYDVTGDGVGDVAPLFQAVHAAGLAELCELALQAGFTVIELTNGYDAWEGEIDDLADECRTFIG